MQGSGFQPRDKHSRATGFSKVGIPKNFDLQRANTSGIFSSKGLIHFFKKAPKTIQPTNMGCGRVAKEVKNFENDHIFQKLRIR